MEQFYFVYLGDYCGYLEPKINGLIETSLKGQLSAVILMIKPGKPNISSLK